METEIVTKLRSGNATTEDNLNAANEIERLRKYIADLERWGDEGTLLAKHAGRWNFLFFLGHWWASRPKNS